MAKPNLIDLADGPIIPYLIGCCNNYMRHTFPTVPFKSPQHRDIVKTYSAAAMDTLIRTGHPDRDKVIAFVKQLTDYNWWPDQRFMF